MIGRVLSLLLAVVLVAAPDLCAQVRVAPAPAPTGRVSGVVFDSTSARPLADALVQWAQESGDGIRNVRTDARGRFQLDSVVPGRWLVQVAHPRTDSLGLATFTRAVQVKGRGTTTAEIGLPSTFGYLRSLCGTALAGDSLGVLQGTLQPVGTTRSEPGGVSVYWRSYRPSVLGPLQELRSTTATLDEAGRFVACGVPAATPLELVGWRGADSTGVLEVELPEDRIGRLALTVGPARLETITRPRAQSVVDTSLVLRGPARLRGTISGMAGEPLANARIMVHETGLEARTRTDGTFTLGELPLGSHQVEVYALGSRPFTGVVNLLPDVDADVRVTMEKLPTLDTLRVVAMAVADPNLARDLIGFERRRLTGLGAFMTHEEITKKVPKRFEDLFLGRSDAFVGGLNEFPVRLRNWGSVRGIGGPMMGGFCAPYVFLDGFRVDPKSLANDDASVRAGGFLNGFRTVEHVVAVEIYEKPWMAPAEFSGPANAPCGSVVFWTTQRVPPGK